jgi:3,4-dihydroxy-2-butanone 4-phosphate synthase
MKDHMRTYDFSAAISPIEEIVEEARNGRMYILVDAEDRENEGDLVIPAQFATPAQVNFMAKHGRGLICLSLTRERARTLALDMMARENRDQHEDGLHRLYRGARRRHHRHFRGTTAPTRLP